MASSTSKHVMSYIARLQSVHSSYHRTSTRRPYLTAMITGGTLLSVSDLTAQFVTSRFVENYTFDLQRSFALCMFGTFYHGIVSRKIYFIYEYLWGPGRPFLKTFVDCGIHTGFSVIPCFYMMTGLLKGQSANQIYDQFQREWITSWTATSVYWTPLMFINFKYCSPQTRILFVSSGSWVHKSFLSWYSNQQRVKDRAFDYSRREFERDQIRSYRSTLMRCGQE